HHMFSEAEIAELMDQARREQLVPVTTEKDRARMRGKDMPREILHFAVTLEFDDPAKLRDFVADRLFKAREKRFSRR
ncbi:MAG: tetraacyldisaccharide 4'-kinase, partial [Bradyrhizobium guangdongense]